MSLEQCCNLSCKQNILQISDFDQMCVLDRFYCPLWLFSIIMLVSLVIVAIVNHQRVSFKIFY